MAFITIGKKKEAPAPQMQQPFPSELPPDFPQQYDSSLPVDQVNNLRSQGFSDNQIVQSLQRDGYTSQQVFEAMTQASMRAAGPLPQEDSPQGFQPQMQPIEPSMQRMNPDIGGERERIEELAEAIIDEKWEELIKNINKIFEWKEKTDSIIQKMEQRIEDMSKSVDSLQKSIIGKIGEYDQNIINVGTEVKALEKVFQKILPTFTENIGELGRLVNKVKSQKPVPK